MTTDDIDITHLEKLSKEELIHLFTKQAKNIDAGTQKVIHQFLNEVPVDEIYAQRATNNDELSAHEKHAFALMKLYQLLSLSAEKFAQLSKEEITWAGDIIRYFKFDPEKMFGKERVELARQYRMQHNVTNEEDKKKTRDLLAKKDKADTIFESDSDIPQGDNKLKDAAQDIWRQARTKSK